MSVPKPTEFVIACQTTAGVRVHGWRKEQRHGFYAAAVTDCGVVPVWQGWSWLWLRYQLLNPEKVLMCKRGCWKDAAP